MSRDGAEEKSLSEVSGDELEVGGAPPALSFSRRTVLKWAGGAAAGVIGAAWWPVERIARAAGDGPPGFPAHVELFRDRYKNWAKEIVVEGLWTCRPKSAEDVADVANWAAAAGWRLRPRGAMHGWSPLLVTRDTTADSPIVLVDTAGLSTVGASPDGVFAGAGARMLSVLTHLESRGLGLASVPAIGDISVGGALAIGAHGAAIATRDEVPAERTNLGSVSHSVRELTAIVWDRPSKRYVPRTFTRDDPELTVLACALGRTLVTDVVLDAPPLQYLRCRSYVDISADELFAPANDSGRTLASFFESTGRAEALWYPFTENPWLKVWEIAPSRPLSSRPTSGPYNYPFSDNIPEELADLADEIVTDNPSATPLFGQLTYAFTVAGLTATASHDLWGPAKDTQLYIKSSTLRVRELGLAVLTTRDRLQETVHTLASEWKRLIDEFAARGEYPANMPLEIRASGLDGSLGPSPILSATSPDPSAPDLDVVLYTNSLILTGTSGATAFFAAYERIVRDTLDPAHARVRPEWSKDFAFTADGPETDTATLDAIRDEFRRGRPRPWSWDGAAATLDRLDPARVFSNDFLDVLFS